MSVTIILYKSTSNTSIKIDIFLLYTTLFLLAGFAFFLDAAAAVKQKSISAVEFEKNVTSERCHFNF